MSNGVMQATSRRKRAPGKSEWWNVYVIGVKSLPAWNKIVAHKNYATIQGMRVAGNPNVTGNIGTNLFLYFSVH